MRYLIISDLHSNWEALEAVLAAAEGYYDRVLCCGDLVGYGPDPNRVVEWVRGHVGQVIRGNHDRAAVGLENLEWFNPVARAAALWTQDHLTPENADYVKQLPKGPADVDGFLLAHGSPLDEDLYLINTSEALQHFPYLEFPLTFFGHTHVQGGFSWSSGEARSLGKPAVEKVPAPLRLEKHAIYLVNPGSVGQPRDHDPRAAYAIYDPDAYAVQFGRAKYDVPAVQAKIRAAGLPGILADRLALGR